jgi:hypothetical protein
MSGDVLIQGISLSRWKKRVIWIVHRMSLRVCIIWKNRDDCLSGRKIFSCGNGYMVYETGYENIFFIPVQKLPLSMELVPVFLYGKFIVPV